MKIVFDTESCKKNCKDIDLILYLLSFAASAKITCNTFEKARQQGFLQFKIPHQRGTFFPDYVELNERGEFLVESIMADSHTNASKQANEDRYTALANKLRELYPEGKKPGYAYTWRDSTTVIADRLKKFMLKYGDHTDEEIIDATKRYIASFNGDYKYMQLLKYFIWKNKVTGGELVDGRLVGEVEKQSQLASYIENQEGSFDSNWESELK